eukprot:scaffold2592_cov145-Skeletonema_menzelii.AAC.7
MMWVIALASQSSQEVYGAIVALMASVSLISWPIRAEEKKWKSIRPSGGCVGEHFSSHKLAVVDIMDGEDIDGNSVDVTALHSRRATGRQQQAGAGVDMDMWVGRLRFMFPDIR